MSLRHAGGTYGNQFLSSKKLSRESTIESPSSKFFRKRRRTARAIFDCGGRRNEDGVTGAIVPKESRPKDAALICGQICPPVFIDVIALLKMCATNERIIPSILRGFGNPKNSIAPAASCRIEEQLL